MDTSDHNQTPILQLVYTSRATVPFDDDSLMTLLDKARGSNHGDDVTGVLLYHEGTFVQAIEGPESAVRALYERISPDPRHDNIRIVAELRTSDRSFGEWSMGFRRIDPTVERPEGLDDFLESGFVSLADLDPEQVRDVLLGFVGVTVDS